MTVIFAAIALGVALAAVFLAFWSFRRSERLRGDFDAHRRATPAAIRAEVVTTAMHLQFARGPRDTWPGLPRPARPAMGSDPGLS